MSKQIDQEQALSNIGEHMGGFIKRDTERSLEKKFAAPPQVDELDEYMTISDILSHTGVGDCGNPFCHKPNMSHDDAVAAIQAWRDKEVKKAVLTRASKAQFNHVPSAVRAVIIELQRIDEANKGNGISFYFGNKDHNNGWFTMRDYVPYRIAELTNDTEYCHANHTKLPCQNCPVPVATFTNDSKEENKS
jgi:hypothetical protein